MQKYKSRGFVITSFILLLITLASLQAHAQQADLVGAAGDLSAIQITGCKIIPTKNVLNALKEDPDACAAASPSAKLSDFINTVQDRLTIGYSAAGFPQAKISVELDPAGDHLDVTVMEGPRYMAGPVHVVGAKTVDAKELVMGLTTPSPAVAIPVQGFADQGACSIPTSDDRSIASNDIDWEIGKPADVSASSVHEYQERILASLFEHGLFWADVKVESKLQPNGTADLWVTILDEGPIGILKEIEVNGLKINNRQDLLDFVGLKPDMPVDLSTLRQVHEKLWESGRFVQFGLRAEFQPLSIGRVKIILDMEEHPKAPPLPKSIDDNPIQGMMVRAGIAMHKALLDSVPLVATLDGHRLHIRVVVQNNHGAAASIRTDPPAPVPTTQPDKGLLLLFDHLIPSRAADINIISLPQKILLWSNAAGRMMTDSANASVAIQLKLGLSDHDTSGHFYSITAGFNVNRGESLTLHDDIPPVAWLDFVTPAHKPDLKAAQQDNGQCILDSGNFQCVIDPKTSRFVECRGEQNGYAIKLSLQPNAMDHEIERGHAQMAGMPDQFDSRQPLESTMEFFANVFGKPSATSPKATLSQPRDGNSTPDNVGDEFYIPNDIGTFENHPASAGRLFLYVPDTLFPYGSWPWTLGHEGLLLVSGGSPNANDELRRIISSNDTGPVGCAVIAMSLKPVDSSLSRAIADIGLGRLEASQFRKDFEVLLKSKTPSSFVLARLLQSVADLDDNDAAALIAVLPPDIADNVQFIREQAKSHPGVPIVQTLDDSLGPWYRQHLRKVIETWLQSMK